MRRLALGWGGLALSGLVLAFVGLLGPWQELEGGGPAVLLSPRLPEALRVAILALLSLAVLLFLALVLPIKIRRRRKDDEEFELYHEPRKLSPWALLLLLALALAPMGGAAALLWVNWPESETVVGAPGHASAPGGPPPGGSSAPAARPTVSLPAFSGAVGGLALLAALAALALMLWISFGDRLAWWWTGPVADSRARQPLIEVVEASLEDLRREPDVRRAIILCYRRFEQALARSGVPREAAETPGEFMRRALARLSLPSGAVAGLTWLFELSRFSHHRLGPPERDTALDSLIEIRTALERAGSHATAA
ncbi:MAG: DUF4129 domain-containing protein [Candidatus Rokubacteria bacterium]|nr:DUF4129 domain-containing protein [Candidatus Rokubacteria bacterium]